MNVEAFLGAPLEEVRRVAPETMIWTVEGTRRSAALAGVQVASDQFPRWSVLEMYQCLRIIFSHGVRHVFTPVFSPSQFSEVTPKYREHIERWMRMFSEDPLLDQPLRQSGWRVRLIGGNRLPGLRALEQHFLEATPRESAHTLWLMVISEPDQLWDDVLAAMARSGGRSRKELIRALYGEDIEPATLLVSFGKPVVSPDQMPPLLVGKMNCYWSQKPGYRLTERDFRKILFDASVVRRTWQSDKTGRHEQALAHRREWEEGPIVGLGTRVGPHWYPLQDGFSRE